MQRPENWLLDMTTFAVKNRVKTANGRRGRPFTKGVSGNPAGRPKGAKNKASIEIKLFFRELLDDPDYAARFLEAWRARQLHPSLEQMAYHYAHGKPVQSIDLGVSFDPMKHLADLARKAGIATDN